MRDKLPIAASLDITLEVCPMTFVKTKLELEELDVGECLEVFLREGEPFENVARSCEEEGHAVRHREKVRDRIWRLVVQRGA